jgi:hypothetical protein
MTTTNEEIELINKKLQSMENPIQISSIFNNIDDSKIEDLYNNLSELSRDDKIQLIKSIGKKNSKLSTIYNFVDVSVDDINIVKENLRNRIKN